MAGRAPRVLLLLTAKRCRAGGLFIYSVLASRTICAASAGVAALASINRARVSKSWLYCAFVIVCIVSPSSCHIRVFRPRDYIILNRISFVNRKLKIFISFFNYFLCPFLLSFGHGARVFSVLLPFLPCWIAAGFAFFGTVSGIGEQFRQSRRALPEVAEAHRRGISRSGEGPVSPLNTEKNKKDKKGVDKYNFI